MSARWPFTGDQMVKHIEADPGDRVLPDGTKIIGAYWGHGSWSAFVVTKDGQGFGTQSTTEGGRWKAVSQPSRAKALDYAERKYYALRAEGWPSQEYYQRIICQRDQERSAMNLLHPDAEDRPVRRAIRAVLNETWLQVWLEITAALWAITAAAMAFTQQWLWAAVWAAGFVGVVVLAYKLRRRGGTS